MPKPRVATSLHSVGTYTPITGGTVMNTTIPDSWEDGIDLVPAFYFCGTFYNKAWVTSNGLISLGGNAGPGSTQYNGIANTGNGSGINLAVLNADLRNSTMSGVSSNIRYQLVGNEHVIQWQDASRWAADVSERISFQARLNTVTGAVTYVYKADTVSTSTSYQPIVGIRTATSAGNWQSRTVANNATSSWDASTLSTATTDACRLTTTTTNPKKPPIGLTYVWTPPTPVPSCTSLTFPTTSNTVASPASICISSKVNLSLSATIPTAGTGISFIWSSGPSATGPWTAMGTTTIPTFTTPTAITVNTYFKCDVKCNTSTVLSSSPLLVPVTSPGTPTVTGGSRCGPGTVALSATAPVGNSLNWYASATGGMPLGTGTNFTTPFIPTTTNFYVGANTGSTPTVAQIGTATTISSGSSVGPYNQWYRRSVMQFMYTGAEIVAANGGPGSINSIAFNCAALPTYAFSNYTIKIGTAPASMTTLTWQPLSAMTTVYSAATYQPTATGWQTLNFTAPFPYNGLDNIVVEVCWDYITGGISSTAGTHEYTTKTGRFLYTWTDDPGSSCGEIGVNTNSNLPNVRFGMNVICEGPRIPVTATITPGPAVTKSVPSIICNNTPAPMSIASSPMSNYTNYVWSPITDLYTDAACTVPYMGGNAPNVYIKSTTPGAREYYMMASGATAAACTAADTLKTWIQPGGVSLKAVQDTVCAPSGSTTIKLVPANGYAPNSIQWQEGTNGVVYNDINGATGLTYTTPSISANHWYRAQIKATSGICLQPTKQIVVADPVLLSWADSFHCGPGKVTLHATAGGNGGVKWYNSPTSSIPIGSGDYFETPILTSTSNFYVASGTGTVQPGPTFVGNGTSADWWGYCPYFGAYYYNNKVQWMIKASELQAAGFGPGLITGIAFDVTTRGGSTPIKDLSYKMKMTNAASLSNFEFGGFQDVFYTASYLPTANAINSHVLTDPFFWDGVQNLIIEECSNGGGTSPNTYVNVKYNTTMPNGCVYFYSTSPSNMNNSCSNPTYEYTSSYRPNIRFTMLGGCESPRKPVTAFIHPVPEVDLGAPINRCVDEGDAIVLNAGVQPHTPAFLWDDMSTSQIRAITTSGIYNVAVKNVYGCIGYDTIEVILRPNPVVDLGNDTLVCNGVVVPLDAGPDGTDYYWNTGSSSRYVEASAAGKYIAFVTNADGCMKSDTIQVTMAGELPAIDYIHVWNNGVNTFRFTAVNPVNVIGYEWDFGDGTPPSYQAAPTHTFTTNGFHNVILRITSTCGFLIDSTSANIVGVGDIVLDKGKVSIYPNPANDVVKVVSDGGVKIQRLEMFGILGQLVYTATPDSEHEHTINLSSFAPGMYSIRIHTDQGIANKKLELVR